MREKIAILTVLTAIVVLCPKAQAQWVQTNGPGGGDVICLSLKDTTLYAGVAGGVFRSSDNGVHWVYSGLKNNNVGALVVSGNDLYAGIGYGGGVFHSTNNGTSWSYIGLDQFTIYSLAVSGNYLLAGTNSFIYRSSDNGANWIIDTVGLRSTSINTLEVLGSKLFAGTDNGAYCSTNDGASWKQIDTAFKGDFRSFALIGDNLFEGTGSGMRVYNDSSKQGMFIKNGLIDDNIHALLCVDSIVYAATDFGVARTTDEGANWTPTYTSGGLYLVVLSLAAKDSELFAGTLGSGVFRSTDHGISWNSFNNGLPYNKVGSLAYIDSTLFAGTYGVYKTTNEGADWSSALNGLTYPYNDYLASGNGNIFAATERGIYRSSNKGAHWTLASEGLPYDKHITNDTLYWSINTLFANGNNIFAGSGFGVFLSTNNGASWSIIDTGLPIDNSNVTSFAMIGNELFAVIPGKGVYRSTNDGLNWDSAGNVPANINMYVIVANGNDLFVRTDSGAFRSTDNGDNWIAVNNGLPGRFIDVLMASNNVLFAGTDSAGVYISTNKGTNWISANDGLMNTTVLAFAIYGGNIFAGTDSGVYRRPLSDFGISAVNEKPNDLPAQFSLQQNYPNPFSANTNVEYRIPNEEHVTLSIYNSLGEEVATLVNSESSAGTHSVQLSGNGLQNGIYFYRLAAGKSVGIGKMMVIH